MANSSVSAERADAEQGLHGSETDWLLGKKDAPQRSYCRVIRWLEDLHNEFGYGLLALLFVTEHLNKGFAFTVQGNAEPYLYKLYNTPAQTSQIFQSITSLPWAAKPMIGLVSDVLPIWGFHKGPYLFLYSVLGALAFLALSILPYSIVPVIVCVVMVFLANLQESACDTLSEAKYAEQIVIKPQHGPDILTYVWFGLTAAGMVGTLISGFILEYWGPRLIYILCIPVAISVFYPVLRGHVGEQCQSEEQVEKTREKIAKQWEACVLSVVVFSCSLLLAVCGCITQSPVFNASISLLVCIAMLVSYSIFLSPVIAKLNVFLFLDMALSFDISGATFYFYTDSPSEYPDGPHFSPFFYTTVVGIVGSIFSLVGIYCYNRFTYDWTYRNLMIAVNLVGSAFGALDVIMFARLNLKLGIPDHFMVLGSSVFSDIFNMWSWMPMVVVLSHLCPPGMEATTYALLAGSSNLGETVADNFGSLLLQILHCDPKGAVGDSSQFQNLWLASVITTVLPLVEIIGLIWLLPNARQNEKVAMDSERDITSGSLWKQWTHEARGYVPTSTVEKEACDNLPS